MSNVDSELEEDEEEYLIHVEFENLDPNVFTDENLKMDMLGIDSEHPVMQINGKFFQGTFEDALGTYLYFEDDDNPKVTDSEFDKAIPNIKYYNKSRKVLKMQRVFVEPNLDVLGDSEDAKCKPNLETVQEAGVPPIYQQAALEFWDNAREDRITALKNYLEKAKFREELRSKGFEPESESDEDNPFAMYKYMEEEQAVNNETDAEEEAILPDAIESTDEPSTSGPVENRT